MVWVRQTSSTKPKTGSESPEGAKGRVRLVGSKQATTLSGQEMEDLAAWVTSEEESSAVERELDQSF